MAFLVSGISMAATAYTGAKYLKKASRYLYNSTPPIFNLFGKEHTVIIDPITTLALTALMQFKESHSRIALCHKHVEIQQPSEYQYFINWQWLCRMVQMSSREDLQVIREAIIKTADWFEPQNNETIAELFSHVQDGLVPIYKTYEQKSGNTCSAIREWRGLIEQAKTEGLVWKSKSEKEEEEVAQTSQRIRSIWSNTDIATLNGLFRRAKERQGTTNPGHRILCQTEIQTIETLLQGKTNELMALLKEVNG